jgi:hypothetical protein
MHATGREALRSLKILARKSRCWFLRTHVFLSLSPWERVRVRA